MEGLASLSIRRHLDAAHDMLLMAAAQTSTASMMAIVLSTGSALRHSLHSAEDAVPLLIANDTSQWMQRMYSI